MYAKVREGTLVHTLGMMFLSAMFFIFIYYFI